MLPQHRVDQGVSCLDTGRQGGQLAAGHHDPPLVQHAGKDGDHQVGLHRVVVLGQYPALGDARQIHVVGGVAREHVLSPGDVESEARHWQSGDVHTGQE